MIIAETGTSVRRIVVLYKHGNSAEEIARLMTHLSIAQLYAALTYYHANREEIDTDLAEEQEAYEQSYTTKTSRQIHEHSHMGKKVRFPTG